MKIKQLAFSWLLLFSYTGCANAECVRNEYEVYEELNCAVTAYEQADVELNEAYRKLLASLTAPEQKLLVQAQRAWLAFVAAESKFIYAVEGDGSSGRLVAINSREKHSRLRTKELKNWAIR